MAVRWDGRREVVDEDVEESRHKDATLWEPVPEEPVAGSGVAEPDASSVVLKEHLDPVREADEGGRG